MGLRHPVAASLVQKSPIFVGLFELKRTENLESLLPTNRCHPVVESCSVLNPRP